MEWKRHIKDQFINKCGQCDAAYDVLCHRHINSYCSELFICEQCYKQERKEVEGQHRYDSLVLCDKHNEAIKPIMTKLVSIFENNPNVTVIKDLGL